MGLNVTRALTCKYGAQLSAGRVQTPTLALIVDREEEIRRFVPKEFYTLQVKCQGFSAIWRDKNGQARTFDRAQAEQMCIRDRYWPEAEGEEQEIHVFLALKQEGEHGGQAGL